MKEKRSWPIDYPGGPLGQAIILALCAVGLVFAIGTITHGS